MPGGVNLGNAYGTIDINTGQAHSSILGLQKGVGGLQGGLLGLNPVLTATGLALGGATAAAGGLTAAIGYSIGKSADLQEQLSGIKAVTGATNEEVADLRDLIDDLSLDPGLKVTAFEAADAIELLGRNGLAVEQIMNGAANATVLLANATGAEFGPAADVATDTMAIFNIKAEDMIQAVDGITSVVNNSKFGFDDFRLALAQGGGVAGAAGVEFEDFTTAIAGIAPLFASGADAGTSFKVLLQRLAPTSSRAQDAMAELGLITEDGTNRFYDANGQLKDMAEISRILHGALSGLSEEQRTTALSTIFGTDAMRAAVGLMELGATSADGMSTEFEKLQAAMGETSAAENAATRMDNLRGSIEILRGVIDSITLGIGDKFLPIATGAVQRFTEFLKANADAIIEFFGYLADGITTIQDFTSSVLDSVDAGGVIGELGAIFLGINTDIYDTSDAIRDFLFALGLSPETVDSADSIIRTLGEGFQNLVSSAKDGAAVVGEFVIAIIDGFNEGGLTGATDAFWSWVTGSGGVIATGPGILNMILDMINNFLLDQWPVISETLRGWGDQFWNWVTEVAIPRAFEELAKLGDAMQQWAESPDGSQRLQLLGFALATALLGGLESALSDQERIGGLLGALVSGVAGAVPSLLEGYLSVGSEIAKGVFAGVFEYVTGTEARDGTIAVFSGLWRGVMEALIATVIPGTSLAFAKGSFEQLWEHIKEMSWSEIGNAIVEGVAVGITAGAGAIADAALDAAKDALSVATSFLRTGSPSRTTADEIGRPFSEGVAMGITQAAPGVNQAVTDSIAAPIDGLTAVKAAQDVALANTASTAGAGVTNNSPTYAPVFNITGDNAREIGDEIERRLEQLFDGAQGGSFAYG